jgi:hypothetical protein
MGVNFFDYWSLGHCIMGSLSQALFESIGTNIVLNFILTNFAHLMIEYFEKDVKYGKLEESYVNHMTDIIFFLLGWYISYVINFSKYIPEKSVSILFGILISTFLKEVLIELYIDKADIIKTIWFITIMVLVMVFVTVLITTM